MAITGYPEMVIMMTSIHGYGWSETYRWAGTNTGNALVGDMLNVVNKRRAWMSNDAGIVRIRLQSTFKRDPLIYSFNPTTVGVGQYGNHQNNTDNALLIRSERVGVGFNRQLVRGIPDNLVVDNQFTPDDQWLTSYNAWKAYVLGSGFFGVEAQVDNPQTPKTVASLSQATPRGIKMILGVGETLGAVTKVRITGASVFGYNGVKNVISGGLPASPTLYYLGGATPPADNPVGDTMRCIPQVPLWGTIEQYFIENFTTRKAGRPFGQRPGRARTRLSLRPSIRVG